MIQPMAELKQPGVAIHHDRQAHTLAFYGMSGAVVQHIYAHGDQWNNLTDAAALAAVRRLVTVPGGFDSFTEPDDLPHAIFVKTAAGKLGVLQVTRFINDPPGVKIRYKLLRDSKARVLSTTPLRAPAAKRREATFGPVVERVLEALHSGTNMFLDLDAGRLTTPPAEVVDALSTGNSPHDIERYWQGLDIMDNTRPSRYVAWLRENGIDLMFNGNGEVLAFDGVWVVAHGTNSLNWDNWDGLTPEMTRIALKVVEDASRGSASGVTIGSTAYGESYTSAKRLHSWYGSLVVNQLTQEQSLMWFFKTREGGIGILQITGFTEHPRGVKIRYKMALASGLAVEELRAERAARDQFQFRWVAAEDDTNSPADLLPAADNRVGPPKMRVLREVVLSSLDVDSAGFSQYGSDQKELSVFLSPRGGEKFAAATAQNIGRQLAIVWRGRVISAPVIRSEIPGRRVPIIANLSDSQALQLLDMLNHRVQTKQVGPSN